MFASNCLISGGKANRVLCYSIMSRLDASTITIGSSSPFSRRNDSLEFSSTGAQVGSDLMSLGCYVLSTTKEHQALLSALQ